MTTAQIVGTAGPSALARQLGYAGLLPFVALAVLLWSVRADLQGWVAIALAAYAAVIASFLGGIHWGIAQRLDAVAGRRHILWGVVPSLVAWVAVVMPAFASLPLLGLLLAVCYAVDRRAYPAAGLALWLPMRLQLTLVAVASCLVGAAAV